MNSKILPTFFLSRSSRGYRDLSFEHEKKAHQKCTEKKIIICNARTHILFLPGEQILVSLNDMGSFCFVSCLFICLHV